MRQPILTLAVTATLFGAAPNPVEWKIEGAPARAVKPGARFNLNLIAQVESGWHLYSTKPLEGGPIPTRIWLAEGQPFELGGAIKSDPPETIHDPNFDMEVEFYEGQAEFSLPIHVASGAPDSARKLQIMASYQACNDKMCLPPKTVAIEAAVEIRK
jgi:thiol:disulfide interchange protein DsbD